MKVDILALSGVLDAALGITRDVLFAANRVQDATKREGQRFDVRLCSPSEVLHTGTGLRITAEARSLRPTSDLLIVLGMNVPTPREIEQALARSDTQEAIHMIARAHARGTMIATACAGTFLCAEAGILHALTAATSWWLGPYFQSRHPDVTLQQDAMLAAHKHVVTAGAALSQIDLMLWIVKKYCGPQVADLCARYLVLDERSSQACYLLVDHVAHASEEVARAEDYARTHLHLPMSVADLARAAGTSARTLDRKFRSALAMSPLQYVRRLRAEHAAHLLRTTQMKTLAIAAKVGYEDEGTLRRLLKDELGASPRTLRPRI